MDSEELQPIYQFLKQVPPFNDLPETLLTTCCRAITIGYYSKTMKTVPLTNSDLMLYVIRSGAFEVKEKTGILIDRLEEGDTFGFPSLLSGDEISNQIQILEDGLVYHIPANIFDLLRSENRNFDRFFNRAYAQRLRHEGRYRSREITSTSRITTIMTRALININPQATITQAAKLMQTHRISSLLVIDNQNLVGILTDKDLRNRILANGLNGDTLVSQAMSSSPVTIESSGLIFDAMLLMSQNNVHHLPVMENNITVGVVSSADILKSQSSQPLFLISEIKRQSDLEKLIKVSRKIPQLLHSLISADARAEEIGRILTNVTDVLTQQLIELNVAILGEPPMAFCWLAFGSQGRQDQVACSDQDNGLLLAETPNEQEERYFKSLAEAVCAGLDACGFCFCPGNIMAQNAQWRLSLKQWQQQFSKWIMQPDPQALLHASIFFDLRNVYGSQELFDALQEQVLNESKGNDIFIAALTANAVTQSPPLGFFRQFVLERDGTEVKGIDLKHKGSALINDIARVYALAAGVKTVNTAKRIQALMQQKKLNRKDALNLADAHEYIAHQRLVNQGQQFEHRQPCDNYLRPQTLSSLHRYQLRDAFKVVHDAQAALKFKFMRHF